MKNKGLEDNGLWLALVLLTEVSAILGALFLTIFGLKAIIYSDINATMLWTGFSLFWCGKGLSRVLYSLNNIAKREDKYNE